MISITFADWTDSLPFLGSQHFMKHKVIKYKCTFAVSALTLAIASMAAAQNTYPGANPPDDVNIRGTLTVDAVDPAPVSTGTAPTATVPVLNVGPGATTAANPNFVQTYSTNGSGTQTETSTTGGGVVATTDGNVTLNVQNQQVNTTSYAIETRELKVSNPAGYTVQVGDPASYGAPGTLIPNGTTLPGSAEDVATVRDAGGNLLSVISDLPGVGPVLAMDGAGNPILTPAQITAAMAAGAPPGFFTPGATVSSGGNLVVGRNATITGSTTTNGINNSGAKITSLANGTAVTDAATVGQVTSAVAAEAGIRAAADTALGGRITDEVTARTNADTALGGRIDTEATTRGAADTVLQNNINAEALARSTKDMELMAADVVLGDRITTERNTRAAQDIVLGDRITAANADSIARDNVLQANINNEAATRAAADGALRNDIQTNTRGIAMVAAMTNTTVAPDKQQAIDFNFANFEGENGFGLGYAYRINQNLQVQGATASTTDFEESVVRLGVSYQW